MINQTLKIINIQRQALNNKEKTKAPLTANNYKSRNPQLINISPGQALGQGQVVKAGGYKLQKQAKKATI